MGRFAFCLSVVVVVSIFFDFGVSSAGARVLALSSDRDSERRALGALVLMTVVIALAFSLFVAAAAVPIDLIFGTNVRWLLAGTAALAFFHPFQLLVEQSCQGLNQIRRLSIFQLVMSGSYLLGLIALAAFERLTAGTALGAYLTGIGLGAAFTMFRLKPHFTAVAPFIKLTLKETRGYGFNIYLARVSGMVSSRSDQLVIRYFLTDASLGMYAMVQRFSNPIATMSRSLATTRFRAFAKIDRVPAKITRWNAIALIGAAGALVAFGPIALRLFFPKYAAAATLLVPFAVMNVFVGLFQPYNLFLASHGRGAELRNIVLIVGVATISSLAIVVPAFGITGAAWTGAGAMALDCLLHLLYYRRFIRTLGVGEGSHSENGNTRTTSA